MQQENQTLKIEVEKGKTAEQVLNNDLQNTKSNLELSTRKFHEFDGEVERLKLDCELLKKENAQLKQEGNSLHTAKSTSEISLGKATEELRQLNETAKRVQEELGFKNQELQKKKEEYEKMKREFQDLQDRYKRLVTDHSACIVTPHTSIIPVVYDDPSQNFSSILEAFNSLLGESKDHKGKVFLRYYALETLPSYDGHTPALYFFSSPAGRYDEEITSERKKEVERRYKGPVKVLAFRYGTNPNMFSEVPTSEVHFQFVYNGQGLTPGNRLNDDHLRKFLKEVF